MRPLPVPKVSAIIIVRDGEPFIAEAIASVLAQEGVEWELLVVDDGSRDNTVQVVRAHAEASAARIALLHHPHGENRGMSASRNLGIAHARGEYVAFLDADDLWLPGKLARQVAILDAEPATALVYGRTEIWHSWLEGSSRPDYFFELGVTPDATYPAGALFAHLLANRFQSPTTCNAMMRRTALEQVGGFDPRFRNMFEDQILFAKLLLRFPAHVASPCWARYRQHEMSTSAAFRDPFVLDRAHLRYLGVLFRHVLGCGHARAAHLGVVIRAMAEVTRRLARRQLARAVRRCLRRGAGRHRAFPRNG